MHYSAFALNIAISGVAGFPEKLAEELGCRILELSDKFTEWTVLANFLLPCGGQCICFVRLCNVRSA